MIEKVVMWQDIAAKYPDKWLVFKNARKEGPDIISGILVDVLSDNEITDYRVKHFDEKFDYERTTEGEWNGIIDSNFSISID